MFRHPIYTVLCMAACGYLLWSNVRGWTPFYFAKQQAARAMGGTRFFHK